MEFYSEPWFYYRTNFPRLFGVFRGPFEVECYSEPRTYYITNFPRFFPVFRSPFEVEINLDLITPQPVTEN